MYLFKVRGSFREIFFLKACTIGKTEFLCARSPRCRDGRNSLHEHTCTRPALLKNISTLARKKFPAGQTRLEKKDEKWKKAKGRLVLKSVERDLLIAAFLRSGTITWYLILFKRNRRRRSLKKGVLTAPLQISPERASSPFHPWNKRVRAKPPWIALFLHLNTANS